MHTATTEFRSRDTPVLETHNLLIAYILWLVGFTGAHRFYLGRPVSGTVYLLTLGLLGIGWLLDAFFIPDMHREANHTYAFGQYDYSMAWILLIFLGVFGVHRMYLGKWLTGALYFFTGGLFFFGVIYDFITLNEQVDDLNRQA